MLMNLIEAYINDEDYDRKGVMLFLDMEKAFDRVSFRFLMDAMKALGFGENFRDTIGMMYNNDDPPLRRVYANGYYSKWFPIHSGPRDAVWRYALLGLHRRW